MHDCIPKKYKTIRFSLILATSSNRPRNVNSSEISDTFNNLQVQIKILYKICDINQIQTENYNMYL